LIVGLGNPGPNYKHTRHNVGYWFVQELATKYDLIFRQENKFKGVIAKKENCWLLLPETFMNKSGEAVKVLADFYKISSQEILVVHDELDFTPGIIRLKYSGGHNGHNGIRNIIDHLNTDQFYRLRIGIGRPQSKDEVTNYVLQSPSQPDLQQIINAIDNGLKIMPYIFANDMEQAIQQLHSIK
jgi:peptidyl-tRNA hydrolase, PTH1 family